MKLSLKDTLDYVFQLVIILGGIQGFIYAARIPNDESIELPKKFVVILMYFAVLMIVYMELSRYKELQIKKLEKEKELKKEPEKELKPYEERTFPFKIDRAKALRLLVYAAFVAAAIIQYTRVYGGVGP